ncbi:MAG: tetratricopeptide repeat protein [Acidobacteria bacterium]|jgi:predicted negative regulator of RcsB-dependent stress response|nr:tetratricopeptide repeat protein [Acidobacteriota bacterium]
MKKKEREHLKEDPFQIFIEKTLGWLQKFKKEIVISAAAVVGIVLIILLVIFLKSGSISTENRLYSEAIAIQESQTLTLDQKIEQLKKLNSKSGISADIQISLAALYFEKGDLAKTREILEKFSGSKFRIINDKKTLLEAEVLNSSGKEKEALDILYKLYSDPKSEISKDFILLKMARIQFKTGQLDMAAANLKKISEDYPQSVYDRESQTLLNEIEHK